MLPWLRLLLSCLQALYIDLLSSFTFSFAFVQSMATLQFQVPVPWTTAKLVPEALKRRLHVVEDPAMIHLLGRVKFVELAVFGLVGWQKKVKFSPFQLCP